MTNELTECLCCGNSLKPLIDFGPMPLVNTYHITDKFPLAVNRCTSCCHLQLSHFVDPEVLYKNYAYQSGTGQTARDFFAEFARIALSYYPSAKNVLDIACNDGSQLDAFAYHGLATFGVDPAKNLTEIAAKKGHSVRTMFCESMGMLSVMQKYDILTAQNVIAHTPRPLEFLKQCALMMHDDSRLFIVTSQANMIVNGECDTIYHEHVSYFNAHSMSELAYHAYLEIVDFCLHDIHGTSFVFVLQKMKLPRTPWPKSFESRWVWEGLIGMTQEPIYEWWREDAQENVERVKRKVTALREQGYYLVGCGAAAKGVSMLNMANVKLDVIVDSTPTKWGKETNGMPILPFDRIEYLTHEKVAFVILPFNLRDEIRRNVVALRDKRQDVFVDLK